MNVMASFFNQVSVTSYLNIATQYPGASGVIENVPGAVRTAGLFLDTRAYPHAGTKDDPLVYSDIENEVTRVISQQNWALDANTVFFVFTGVDYATGSVIEECNPLGRCTYQGSFCGYHRYFDSNGTTIHYAYLVAFGYEKGCGALDVPVFDPAPYQENVAMSHEFMEMVTDPEQNAWVVHDPNNPLAEIEIGDDACNGVSFPSPGLGAGFVQELWSNHLQRCIPGLPWITRVLPSEGGDLGGDKIEIDGSGLQAGHGLPQITFGGIPAAVDNCFFDVACIVHDPIVFTSVDQSMNVDATVDGITSPPNPPSSTFQYWAGVRNCSSKLLCQVPSGYPDLVVHCPQPAEFYSYFGVPPALSNNDLGNGNDSPPVSTSQWGGELGACDLSSNACAFFSLYEASPNYCGPPPPNPPQPPGFCDDCRRTGGVCTTDSNGRKHCVHV
jgi:hypothetical protein